MHTCYPCKSGDGPILHCTACFSGRGRVPGAEQYSQRPAVQKSIGKSFNLRVIGFVITSKSIGARLALNNQQLKLWSKDDQESLSELPESSALHTEAKACASSSQFQASAHPFGRSVSDISPEMAEKMFSSLSIAEMQDENNGATSHGMRSGKTKSQHMSDRSAPIYQHQAAASRYNASGRDAVYGATSQEVESASDSDTSSLEGEDESPLALLASRPRFAPTSGLGSSAHVTLGTVLGCEARQTGFDQMEIIDCEEKNLGNQRCRCLSVEGAMIKHYGGSRCVVYLDEPQIFKALFTARY